MKAQEREVTKTQKAKQFFRQLRELGVVDWSTEKGLIGKVWISSHDKAYRLKDISDQHLSNIMTKYRMNNEAIPENLLIEEERRQNERAKV